MQLKLVTLAYDSNTGTFPSDPLSAIDGEIINVVEHFFHDNGQPRLLLIVHYRPHREDQPARRPSRNNLVGVRSELSPPEQALFDRLRAWRNGRAQADGVPPYVLLDNRQVAEIARRRPTTLAALCQINGIGDRKAGEFGKDILALITQPEPAHPTAQPGPAQASPEPAAPSP